jgi:hypothetical protein
MIISEREIMNFIKLRALLVPGASDPDTMFKRLEFKVTREMLMNMVNRSPMGASEAEDLVKKHLGTKFAEECLGTLEIRSEREWHSDSVKYEMGAVVISKREFMDIIRFCVENYAPKLDDSSTINDYQED